MKTTIKVEVAIVIVIAKNGMGAIIEDKENCIEISEQCIALALGLTK